MASGRMIEIQSVEANWREDSERCRNAYKLKRAVREATADCPCDGCEQRDACRQTGHQCSRFRDWVQRGKC